MAEQDAIFKILEMLQNGTITAEQADRLIRELKLSSQGEESTQSRRTPPPEADLFSTFQNLGAQVAKGFEDMAKGFGVNVKQAMGVPVFQTMTIKTCRIDPEKELSRIQIPLHLFQAVKGVLTNKLFTGATPLIDFDMVYKTLDEGTGGKMAEFSDLQKNERVEFWLE